MKPAVVVDVGWVNGLAASGRSGGPAMRVLALDHRQSALGFRSRYAEPVLTPDPQDEEAFVEFLAGLERRGRAGLRDPRRAAERDRARGAGRLGDRFLYPFPPWEVLARIQTQALAARGCRGGGIPAPHTAYPALGPRRARPQRSSASRCS